MKFESVNHHPLIGLTKTIILMLTLVQLISCRGTGGNDPLQTEAVQFSLINNKSWKQSCYEQKDNLGNSTYHEDFITFEYYSLFVFWYYDFTLKSIQYTDPGCTLTSKLLTEETRGTYSINSSGQLILSFEEFFITMNSQYQTAISNTNNFCQLNDWELGEIRNVEGKICLNGTPTFYEDKTVDLDIYKFVGDDSRIFIDGDEFRSIPKIP